MSDRLSQHSASADGSYRPIEFRLIEESLEGGALRVGVCGELDIDTAPQLKEALENAAAGGNGRVIVDLSECLFVDSSGLAAILHGARDAQSNGGGFSVVCSRPNILRLFELTTLNLSLPIYDSVPQALTDERSSLPM